MSALTTARSSNDDTMPAAWRRNAEASRSTTAARLADRWRRHRASLAWFLPVALVGVVLAVINLGGAPQRIDDEGTYTAQAWAVLNLGELTHYTYWYDHPPLGWLQIAGWAGLTGAFARYDLAVLAGREFMVVAFAVSMGLLWMLGRRIGLGRPAAAAAVAIFALSPLAVQFHRTVFLDNVATPWLLAAMVLALAPRRQLAAFAGAAICFAVAVLSKETFLLFAPFLIWMMVRNADRTTRRYTLSVAGAVVALLGFGYVLLALIKGELLPGADRVSLMTGISFQLAERTASGSVFDAASQARVTADQWLQLDPVLAVIAPLAALVALLDRRARPIAAALVFHLLFMLRPGYLPIPYVIALLPLAALVIPVAVQWIARQGRSSARAPRRVVGLVAAAVVSVIMVGAAAPAWGPQLRGLALADLDQPMRESQSWLAANVGRDYRLIVDDAMWVDLVEAGFPRDNVVWYYKVDTDPAVQALAPRGWRDYDYVVSTNSMRTFPDAFPNVRDALANSTVVARFGEGERAVEVHRIDAAGAEAARTANEQEASARAAAGAQLVDNASLTMSTPTRDLISGGRLDGRAIIALAQLTASDELSVADLPAVAAEEAVQQPRRRVLIDRIDGGVPGAADADRIRAVVTEQSSRFAADSVELTPDGILVTWGIDRAANVLPAGGDEGG